MAGEFTSVNNAQAEVTYINAVFMQDLLLSTQMVQFCTPPDSQSRNRGGTVRWLAFPEWPSDVTVLDQTTGTDNQLNVSGTAGVSNVDASLNPYGAYIEASQFAFDTMPVGVMDRLAKRCSDAGAAALDTLAMVQVSGAASTSSDYICGTGSATISGANFEASATVLKAQDLAYCKAILDDKGNSGFDHLNGMYGSVFHPSAGAHLQAEAGAATNEVTWSKVNSHVAGSMGQEKILKGDLGALFGIKLFTSPYCYKARYSFTASVYTGWVLAKDGLGASEVQGEGDARARVIIKTPGPNTVSQPLDTQTTIGWAWAGAFKLLDANRCIQVRSKTS